MRILTEFQLIIALCLVSLVTISTGCGPDDDGLFDVSCPSLEPLVFEWFPYERGDLLQFTNTDSATFFRDFGIAAAIRYQDTTYQTLFEGEVCNPYAESIGEEVDQENTILNYRVIDLSNLDEGVAILINISDVNTINAYTQQIAISPDGEISNGANTTATNEGSQTIGGITYDEVIRLDLNEAPEFTIQQDNDIRSIWIARGSGIIRFRDEVLGTFDLEP